MTTRTDTTFTVRQDRRLIRPTQAQPALPAGHHRRAATPSPSAPGRRSTSPSCSTGRARCRATSCASPRRPSPRRSGGSGRTTGSASSSTTTSSTSSSRRPPAAGESRRAAIEQLRTIDARGSTNLGEGWLRGCEQVAGHLARAGRQPLPAADRRPRQRRHHGRRRARPSRRRAARPRRVDLDVRRRQRLRRGTPAGAGRCRRRPLLLHRRRPADRRRHHLRGGRDARDRGSRRRHRGDRPGRHPDRADQPVPGDGARQPDDRRASATSPPTRWSRSSLRLSFPYGDVGRDTGAIVALTDRDGTFAPGGIAATEPVRLTWSYADDAANDRQDRDREVDRVVARLFAARARQEAVGRNRGGDFIHARRALTRDRRADPLLRGR